MFGEQNFLFFFSFEYAADRYLTKNSERNIQMPIN